MRHDNRSLLTKFLRCYREDMRNKNEEESDQKEELDC